MKEWERSLFKATKFSMTCRLDKQMHAVCMQIYAPGRLMGAMRPVGVVGGKRNVPN